jgi:F-type H+-transporting ATPase subunit b
MNRSMKQFLTVLAAGAMLALPLATLAQDHGHAPSAAVQAGERVAEANTAQALGEAGVHTGGHDAHGADSSPSLLKGPNEALITAITTILVFVVLIIVLGKAAWGPIVKGLAAREGKIRQDIEEAERARAAAEASLKEYNARLAQAQSEVQATLAQATQQAERVAANIKAQAQQDAEETKARAVKDIEAARDQAVREVYAQAADLATTVAGKILRRNLNPQDQQDLVNESLQQLQSVGARS